MENLTVTWFERLFESKHCIECRQPWQIHLTNTSCPAYAATKEMESAFLAANGGVIAAIAEGKGE